MPNTGIRYQKEKNLGRDPHISVVFTRKFHVKD